MSAKFVLNESGAQAIVQYCKILTGNPESFAMQNRAFFLLRHAECLDYKFQLNTYMTCLIDPIRHWSIKANGVDPCPLAPSNDYKGPTAERKANENARGSDSFQGAPQKSQLDSRLDHFDNFKA